ncbi:hypothetical protein [Pseudomonas aeruginosa]|uniref:hypothetical protein n=1 Tax=Pseudomonas aeruginosa TaxID=287 RepID=UPI00157183C3|nr:hypothetical protein [Pseudomonas aeruginosa]NTU04917.1 hypothetical protein [Pseudomonas aeruginosa]NTU07309.1 hypothetical protein [Pseudomonas aeruginosa]
MEIFRRFCKRKADLINADLESVVPNRRSKLVTITFRDWTSNPAKLSAILSEREARHLHKFLGDALAQIDQ